MNLVGELFNEVSFSGTRNGVSIIESNRKDVIDNCCCDSEITSKNEGDKTVDNENKLENTVDKYRRLGELSDENVNKSVDSRINCGKFSELSNEELKAVEAFQNNFHKIALVELQKLRAWCKDISPEVVTKGIEVATLSDRRSMNYLNGVLKNWYEKGVKTIEDCERVCREHEESKSKEKNRREVKPPQYRVLPTERYEDEEDF